mgnify:CR=1 FL=1
MHIVYEETKRMLRGMLPLALVTFGVFALCGQGIARSGASVLLGTAFGQPPSRRHRAFALRGAAM